MPPVPGRRAVALGLVVFAAPAVAQVQTATESWGYNETQDYQYDGQRNDAYETHVGGTFDGLTLFDLTFYRAIDDDDVEAALAAQLQPRGVALHGAPAVLTWGEVEFVDGWEEFVDSLTEVSYSTYTQEFTTTQVTSGDAPDNVVLVGDRGWCWDAGVSGETNSGAMDGRFASCDYGEEFVVEAGTVNTNTHTTTQVTTVERWFTQEDWLNIGYWRVLADATLIGGVHTAAQSTTFDVSTAFRRQLLGAAAPLPGQRWRTWIAAHGGEFDREPAGGIAGDRSDWRGVTGGVEFALPAGFRIGLAADRSDAEVDAIDFPEHAAIDLDQLGLHLRWDGTAAYVALAATQGRGDVDAEHGDASIGGVAVGDYDIETDTLALEAGWRLHFGPLTLVPLVGIERSRMRSDAFVETGGIALAAEDHTAERDVAWGGVDAARTWSFSGDRALQLAGRLVVIDVIDGAGRTLPVALASDPGTPLLITGLPDDERSTLASVGAAFAFSRHVSLALQFEGEWRDDDVARRTTAALRIDW